MPPLDGITVLDLTRVLSGPCWAALLGDMGARDQDRTAGERRRHARLGSAVSRRRERLLPQRQPQQGEHHARFQGARGRAILEELTARSEVLVENFRPGTVAKLGLDYSSRATRHPSIVPYVTFAASDGDVVLAIGNDEQWQRFCRVAALEDDQRFATTRRRVLAYNEPKPIIAARLRARGII